MDTDLVEIVMKPIIFNISGRTSFFPMLFFCAFYQEFSMLVSLPQYFLICTLVYFKNRSDSVIFLIEQSVPPCTLISSVQLDQKYALGILKWRHTCLVPKPWCWVWSRSDTTSPFLQVGVQPYSFPTGVECCLPSACPISLRAHSSLFLFHPVWKPTEITGSYWRERSKGPRSLLCSPSSTFG